MYNPPPHFGIPNARAFALDGSSSQFLHHRHHQQQQIEVSLCDANNNLHGEELSVMVSSDPKPRLRWTPELHDRFVNAVAHLGGPESKLSLSMYVCVCVCVCVHIHNMQCIHFLQKVAMYTFSASTQYAQIHVYIHI